MAKMVVKKITSWNKPQESSVVKGIMRALSKMDGYAWKNHGGRFSGSGLPDVMFLTRQDNKKLLFFAFEVKRAGTANKRIPPEAVGRELWKMQGATNIQAETLNALAEAGACCYVVESVKQVREILSGFGIK